MHLRGSGLEPIQFELVKLLRPVADRLTQIMIEQLVAKAEDDFTILAVGGNEDADVLLREKRNGRLGAKDGAIVTNDLGAAVILNVPAQRVEVEIRLGGRKLRREVPDRSDHSSSPHLL